MYTYLLRVPAWLRVAVVVLAGVLFFGLAVQVTTAEPIDGVQLLAALGVLALLAAVVLPAVVPELGASTSVVGHLTSEERSAAVLAAMGGPTPEDPAVRRAAFEYTRTARDEMEKQWRWGIVVAALAVVLYVLAAVATSVWWLLASVLFGLLPLYWLRERRRLASRAEELEPAGTG